jgi:hypothetical protein
MSYETKMIDRQIGRNAELFSQAVAELPTPEARYPYLRILLSLVDQAHPEWRQAKDKYEQMAGLVDAMCRGTLDRDEVMQALRVRDAERDLPRR